MMKIFKTEFNVPESGLIRVCSLTILPASYEIWQAAINKIIQIFSLGVPMYRKSYCIILSVGIGLSGGCVKWHWHCQNVKVLHMFKFFM